MVAGADDGIRRYIFGFVTPDGIGYVHLIATQTTPAASVSDVACTQPSLKQPNVHRASRLKAITSVENTGSIAFHRSLGFDTKIVDDYNGPGRDMAVFHRDLPLDIPGP